jgi:hypothetical protein
MIDSHARYYTYLLDSIDAFAIQAVTNQRRRRRKCRVFDGISMRGKKGCTQRQVLQPLLQAKRGVE